MHQHPPRRRLGYDEMVLYPQDYGQWLDRQAPEAGGVFGGGVMHNDWTARPWHLAEHLHPTNWTVERALEFLRRRDPTTPFFLTVSFIAPHPPLQPPAFYLERYLRQEMPQPVIGDWATPEGYDLGGNDGVAPSRIDLRGEALRSAQAGYYGLINHMDDQLRRLLNPITGVDVQTARNTIVLLCSDHGEMLGDHGLMTKGPNHYDAGIRVPLIVAGGGVTPGIAERLTSTLDFFPTFCDWAGVEFAARPPLEGRSFAPVCAGTSDPAPWAEVSVASAGVRSVVTADGWRLTRFLRDRQGQLFDLNTDPDEQHNLYASPDHAARRQDLLERLVAVEARPAQLANYSTLPVENGHIWLTSRGHGHFLTEGPAAYPSPPGPYGRD